MKRILAKTLMIALGLGVLAGIAIAQEGAEKKAAPRPSHPYANEAPPKNDFEPQEKAAPRPVNELPKDDIIRDRPEYVDQEAERPLPPASKDDDNGPGVDRKDGSLQEVGRTPADDDVPAPKNTDRFRPSDTTPGQRNAAGAGENAPYARGRGQSAGRPGGRPGAFLRIPGAGPAGGQALGGGRIGADTMVSGEGRLAQASEQLARSIGAAKSDSDKEELKHQLSQILDQQFELRQRRHESEIAELETQVRQLRELVRKRQENRHEIVAKRLEVIVRDAEGLGW